MNLRALKRSFPCTVPVMAGYLSLGIAFGLLMQRSGFGPGWTLLSSLFVFAGSAQFLGVGLLASGASLWQTALLTFVLNFRHLFYGLSMVTKYSGLGACRPYLMFGLTDETYAILSATPAPEGVSEKDFCLSVTLLDHLYWVTGSVLGATVGELITVNTEGLDFAMTALFVVLFVEQWKAHADHRAQLIGLAVILLSLRLFGPDGFLIPGLVVISALLLLMARRDGRKDGEA